MKKTIVLILLVAATQLKAQTKDSLVLQIKMDTTAWKNMIKLIDENIDSRTLTGKMIKESIFTPLFRYELVADKPKKVN